LSPKEKGLEGSTKTCIDRKSDYQRGHSCSDTKNRNDRDDRNDGLLALGLEIANGNLKFEVHENLSLCSKEFDSNCRGGL